MYILAFYARCITKCFHATGNVVLAKGHCSSFCNSLFDCLYHTQGDFALGFWLFIPAFQLDKTTKENSIGIVSTERQSTHLISRIPETADCNLVHMLRDDPAAVIPSASSFSLNLALISNRSAGSCQIVAHLFVQDRHNHSAGKTKCFKKLVVNSGDVPRSCWIRCLLEVVQSTDLPSSPHIEIASASPFNSKLNSDKDITKMSIFVNVSVLYEW
jgi:hypothetical protein